MNRELSETSKILLRAAEPEEVFKIIPQKGSSVLDQASAEYHRLALIVHPDRYFDAEDKNRAQEAFKVLSVLWKNAREKINAGTFGNNKTVIIETKKCRYEVGAKISEQDVANIYRCSFSDNGSVKTASIKVVRNPADNDLLENETKVLRDLYKDSGHEALFPYLPKLLDSFVYNDENRIGRRANVFGETTGFYTLREVREAYPAGVNPKDFAWIFRRLLVALGLAHINGIVHGAVIPELILLEPRQHGLVLSGWEYAVSGKTISAIPTSYESWYPEEVTDSKLPGSGTDIYLAVQSMRFVLGGSPPGNSLPREVPQELRTFFDGCTQTKLSMRPVDAWELKEEFDELIERLWGPRKFHPFVMPPGKI